MKIISLLGEAYNQNKANLPLDKDILYKAKQKYPQYSGTQALTLYIADEMKEKDQVDSNQNRLIDTQTRENERLRGEVQSIGQELANFEQQSIETDREVARLKQLSGMLSTGGTSTQQNAKVSADALEKLQKDLAILKTKPGMDPKVYNELTSQIETLKTNKSTDKEDVKKIQDTIRDIENDASVNYNDVLIQLKDTQKRLKEKEHRFQDYKKKTATNTKKIKEFENEFRIAANLRAGIQQDAQDISDMKDEIRAQLDLVNDVTSKITRQTVSPAQNNPTVAPKSGPGPNADILGSLAAGPESEKNITKGAENMLGRKLAEDTKQKIIKPLQKYGNPEYDEWLTKHLPALIKVFKNKYWRDLEKTDKQYSDEQIHYIIEKYTPMLYNLGDGDTPLTAQQVNNWLVVVKNKLWEQQVQNQLNLFSESLDKIYTRMLDDIIGLAYIKKG